MSSARGRSGAVSVLACSLVQRSWASLQLAAKVKHNNALDRLDETKLELENARAKCLKAGSGRSSGLCVTQRNTSSCWSKIS